MGTDKKSPRLKAPFPWFGGKSRAAHIVWSRFGVVRNYVEPFAGSLAVLLGNPHPPATETINDLDCYVANFWRAVAAAPGEVAAFADWPVSEADLHARHQWLVNRGEFRERMKTDPDFYDAKIAGWWVWGISCWIGGGWCKITGRRPDRSLPSVSYNASRGVHGQAPRSDVGGTDIGAWFGALCYRLRRTRVVCGDWSRVMTPTPVGLTDNVPGGFVTGVLLDPPYDAALRDRDCYAVEGHEISAGVRAWAIEHGDDPRLRIALCGYEGEHTMPDTWSRICWKAGGGYANQNKAGNRNSHLERIWFSPHCLCPHRDELPLQQSEPVDRLRGCDLPHAEQVRARRGKREAALAADLHGEEPPQARSTSSGRGSEGSLTLTTDFTDGHRYGKL